MNNKERDRQVDSLEREIQNVKTLMEFGIKRDLFYEDYIKSLEDQIIELILLVETDEDNTAKRIGGLDVCE